jgi:hypothetical protein
MVSIEGNLSEEDISEGMLGRVLLATVDGGNGSAESNSLISDGSHSTVSTSNITNTNATTTTAPSTNTKKAATAAKVPQDRKHHSSTNATHPNNHGIVPKRTTRTRSSAADPSELFGGIEDVVLPPTKRIRATTRKNGTTASTRLQAGETSVTKVPMLTGTLYLFRGRSRRADFIRHK